MTKRMLYAFLTLLILIFSFAAAASAEDAGSWYDEPIEPPVQEEEQPGGQTADEPPVDKTEPVILPELPMIYFQDVQPTDWYYDYVNPLYEAGVINGFTDGSFRPSSKVTTGQALKMIILAAGYPEPQQAASHWARGYLDFAIDQGFIVRFQDITDLDVSISRQLVAKIAANALLLQRSTDELFFTDTNDDLICALCEAGIVGGYPDGTFRPHGDLTRAELSAIVYRIYEYCRPRADVRTDDSDYDPVRLRTTEQLIEFLKEKEGFLEYATWDYAQYSIGYGTYCDKDEFPNGITREEADYRMRLAIAKFEASLNEFLDKNDLTLTDNQYDALISLSYNIGSNWMKNSNLAQLLISGRYSHNELASAIGIWCHVREKNGMVISEGLLKRRISETRIFLFGDYSGSDDGFCTLLFETEKGDRERDIAVYETGSFYDPLYGAEAPGDVFVGWYTADGRLIDENTRVEEDLTVTARWESGGGSDSGVSEDWQPIWLNP